MIHPDYKVICQADLDMGDAPHRTGIQLVHLAERGKNYEYMELFKAAMWTFHVNGFWIRGGVWQDQKDFSRDQASRLMLGFSYCIEGQKIAKDYYVKASSHSFTHVNGDIFGIGEFAFIIRLFKKWFLYPLLVVLDLRFLVDWIIMHVSNRAAWDYASLVVPDLVHALHNYPTPIAYLCKFLYTASFSKVQKQMLFNHSLEMNGAVELQDATNFFFKKLKGEA